MEQDIEQIPFIAHESAMYHADKTNRRLLAANIFLFLLLIGSSVCSGIIEVLRLKQLNK